MISEAKDVAVAGWAYDGHSTGPDDVASAAESDVRDKIRQSTERLLAEGAFEETVSLMSRLTAELALGEIRRQALDRLALSEEAGAEATAAYAAELRRCHRSENPSRAEESAEEASRLARRRTAEYLLRTRLSTPGTSDRHVDAFHARHPFAQQADRVRAQMKCDAMT
ncbi:hypothetical protein ACWDSD_34215 [Streptomyces spiralis]